MDPARIAALLAPYATVSPAQLGQICRYLDLLLRWNARINLTAVRDPEHIVTRHFGESLFAARHLLGGPPRPRPARQGGETLLDLGAGAGFPGLPLKIYAPDLHLVLVESQNKKAAFLHEVVRALELRDVQVFAGRAQDYPATADLVTLRAVERFDSILPVAVGLLSPTGRLGLLIGSAQIPRAHAALPHFSWSDPVNLPGSSQRVLLVATNKQSQ